MLSFKMNLCCFEKPSRYINREVNSVYKDAPVKTALVFPDIYDVGMSHLGLRILYEVINNLPYASAERVFSPWTDMEAEMKRSGTPLRSLETKRSLGDFDIAGFSLQYELCYTTVLNMLALGNIPLRTRDRDERHPLIIAGGPCTVNPLPMSPFIDAFLIGDGEEAVVDILGGFYEWRLGGDNRKASLLKALSKVEGVYVPSLHGVEGNKAPLIKRRFIASLDDAPYPVAPVVPYTSIIHDRVNIELSRGCTMGCRFCQAGMIYRPLRERSVEKVLQLAEASLKNTGHEEISLTSLSSGDYSQLLPLVKELNRRFSHKNVSLSLPSLRVASVSQDVLREIKTVRKTGFTMAPEAATERLRAAINKDFGEEDYDRALHALFAEGWETLKLYFMVGLPTETEADIEAIPKMAHKAISVAKKYTRRHVNVNVSISPFVSKPHTPMQWCGQEEIGNIRTRLDYLRRSLTKSRITYKGHNLSMSLLEAVFSRGDARLADLIEQAWSLGCRLDAWTEAFNFDKWLKAAEMTGIDLYGYAQKNYKAGDALPWDGLIDTGIRKDYIYKEFQKIGAVEITKACSKLCSGCGLGCKESAELKDQGLCPSFIPIPSLQALRPVRVRAQFSKTGELRFLSHREVMTAITRALRRAEIPVLYSQGFHPSPRVSFGPPLNVGVSGLKEYFDMDIQPLFPLLELEGTINLQLPEGLRLNNSSIIPSNGPSIDSFISRYEYEIICPNAYIIDTFLEKGSIPADRENAAGKKSQVDLRAMVDGAYVVNSDTVRLTVVESEGKKVRLPELLPIIFQSLFEDLQVTRLRMFGWQGGWVEPLDSYVDSIKTENMETAFIK